MADPQVLASVIRISGRVLARNEEGETRALKLSDTVREGETVMTDAGAEVELLFVDGSVTEVAERTTALISAEMSADARPDAAAASIGEATIAQVVEALERGGDLNAQLDATAAGLGGGGGGEGEGSSFVQLLRIFEGVDPLAYLYSFTPQSAPQIDVNPLAVLALDTPAPAPGPAPAPTPAAEPATRASRVRYSLWARVTSASSTPLPKYMPPSNAMIGRWRTGQR